MKLVRVISILLLAAGSSGSVHSAAQPPLLSDDVIDRAGETVMQGNEFRSVRRRVLEQIPLTDVDKGFLQSVLKSTGDWISAAFRRIGDFFEWLFGGNTTTPRAGTPPAARTSGSTPGGVLEIPNLVTPLMIGIILVILIILAAMIVKSVDARRRKARTLPGLHDPLADVLVPPGELAASTYESRAIQAASAGNYRAAIRELLLGSMSWIERAGLIRYRRGLTNRDYLRSIARRDQQRSAFREVAERFEYVFFGRRHPTHEMFEACLAEFRRAFGEEETPTAAV